VITFQNCNAEAVIKIGILAQRGPEITLQEWSGIAQYLTRELGEEVQVVPVDFSEVLSFCWREPQAFLVSDSWLYVRAKVLRGAKALVTLKYQNTSPMFGGVIFCREESPIHSLADLRGQRFMCVSFRSTGGWLFAKGVILQEGEMRPETDFAAVEEGLTDDAVVLAVRDRKAEAGTVRASILEAMHREGKIDMTTFRVLHPMNHDHFQDVCSTPLYPDSPVASLKNTPPELAERLRQALLSLPRGHPALEQARKIDLFLPALDYGPLEKLLTSLKLDPLKIR
jgi:ABC-type phosphate/phosphonate transport system substrate-binding protein